jgi:hypothetical protein
VVAEEGGAEESEEAKLEAELARAKARMRKHQKLQVNGTDGAEERRGWA